LCKINEYTVQHGFKPDSLQVIFSLQESRNSVVEGTAQGNYLRGWGLSVVKGRAQHSSSSAVRTATMTMAAPTTSAGVSGGSSGSFSTSAAAAAGASAHRQRQQRDSARVARADV